MNEKYLQRIKVSEFSNIKKGDEVTLLDGSTFIAGEDASPKWEIKDINGNSHSADTIASPCALKQDDTKYRTLCVCVACQAYYGSEIRVPKDLSLDEAIEYAKDHLDEAPLGNLEYISDSDELDENNCEFAEPEQDEEEELDN